jgi:hypothetical protein
VTARVTPKAPAVLHGHHGMISLMYCEFPRKNSLTVVSLVELRGFCEIRSYCAIGIQRMVEKLFDDVKITSFLNHFPGEGGLSVEYTTKRAITQSDFNDFLKLLKTEKYVVEQSGINDGEISIAAKSSDTYLIVAMKINEQKVNVVLMPTDFTGSEE